MACYFFITNQALISISTDLFWRYISPVLFVRIVSNTHHLQLLLDSCSPKKIIVQLIGLESIVNILVLQDTKFKLLLPVTRLDLIDYSISRLQHVINSPGKD